APSTVGRRRRGPPGARASARVDRPRRTETEAERADERNRRDGPVAATMQISQPIQPLDGQGENRQEPPDHHAVGVVMTDVLHAVAGLALVEPLVLDLPAALGKAVEQPTPTRWGERSVSQYASTMVPSDLCWRYRRTRTVAHRSVSHGSKSSASQSSICSPRSSTLRLGGWLAKRAAAA